MRAGKPYKAAGTAMFLVAMLSMAWSAVESRPVDRGLDRRIDALLEDYVLPDGNPAPRPVVEVVDLGRPAAAASSCIEWRIRIQPGAAETLSDAALDDLLAHELAHLLVCAETGRNAGHGREWWDRYQSLAGLT